MKTILMLEAGATLLLLCNGCVLRHHQTEEAISMQDLPAAVLPLAEQETKGCRIIEVEKEYKNGKEIFAITYDQAGTEMEIEYAKDGTLLFKGKE